MQGPEVARWVYEATKGCLTENTQAIGYVKDKSFIAGMVFEGFNGFNVFCHQRMTEPAPRSYWLAVADYVWNVLKVKRITGTVNASNLRARRLDEHLGFEQEAVLTGAADDGGDLIVYVLWPENCRVSRVINGRQKRSSSGS